MEVGTTSRVPGPSMQKGSLHLFIRQMAVARVWPSRCGGEECGQGAQVAVLFLLLDSHSFDLSQMKKHRVSLCKNNRKSEVEWAGIQPRTSQTKKTEIQECACLRCSPRLPGSWSAFFLPTAAFAPRPSSGAGIAGGKGKHVHLLTLSAAQALDPLPHPRGRFLGFVPCYSRPA